MKSLIYCRPTSREIQAEPRLPKERSCPVSLEFRRSELKDQEHRFELGETVYFTSRPLGHMASNGTYQIVRLLPSDGDDYQYRIKSAAEAFERVAKESQLDNSR
jgi:hypothetical protein